MCVISLEERERERDSEGKDFSFFIKIETKNHPCCGHKINQEGLKSNENELPGTYINGFNSSLILFFHARNKKITVYSLVINT